MLLARQALCRRESVKPVEGGAFFSSISSNRTLTWLAVAIVFVTLCFRLGHLPLLEPDEERNAEVAREMKQSGSWLVPTYDGLDYLDKPIFYFKAVSLSLAAMGDNATAARLPSAAFGLALALLIFVFCRAIYSTRCALLATIIVATTPLYFALARIVIFDMALTFFVCGAIFAGYLAETSEEKNRRKWYWLGAASAGFATLVKGPVGFVVPMLVLLVFNWVEGRRTAWKRLLSPLNLLVFFGVTLPWFVGLCLSHRDFFHYGFVEESLRRFTSAKSFHRTEPVYFYLLIVAGTFFPWSLVLPEASVAMWKERWAKHSADRLCLVWSVVVVLFFSVSQSKMPAYILSVTVACGILLARVFDTALAAPEGRVARLVRRATTAFAIICLLVGAAAMLAGTAQLHALADRMHIPPADAERFRPQAAPLAISLFGFGAFAIVARVRRSASLCFLCLALLSPLCSILNMGMIEAVSESKSGRRLANKLSALPPQTELACMECFPTGLPFYLHRTVTLVSRDGSELTSNYILYSLKNNAQRPEQIVPLDNLDRWLESRKTPIALVIRARHRDELEKIALARSGTIQTLSPEYLVANLPAPRGP